MQSKAKNPVSFFNKPPITMIIRRYLARRGLSITWWYNSRWDSPHIRDTESLKKNYDVIIVGAGPAGATLAYELAAKGIGVLLLEKEKLPRHKCCAGGVTNRAARLLDFDISEVAEDVIYEISFTFNLGNHYLGQHSQPLMHTVMRDAFDHFLVKRAQELGAALVDGQRATRLEVGDDWVGISTADNVLRSRLVVGADGAYGLVARELGIKKSTEYLTGIEAEIVVSEKELAKWRSRAQVDLGCVPGGYAWAFPKRNRLSVGVGSHASKPRDLQVQHRSFLNSLNLGSHTVASSCSHLIPTSTKGRLIWQDKTLLLGDAAGLADPLTGEGIYNAIRSAQLAAPVIAGFLVGGNARLEDYQRIVESEIVSELRIARRLWKFFVRFPHLAFRMLSQNEDVWKALSDLMSGEIKYADLRGRAGGFKGILDRLLRA
jgi:geranylgeranyl reductase family protein